MELIQAKQVVGAAINQLIGAGYYPQQVGDFTSATADADGNPIDGVVNQAGPLTPQQIEALDITALNDLGEAVSANPAARDLVFDTMCDQIGKIVAEARRFTTNIPDVYYNTREWGGVMEWYQMGLAPILDDPMWQQASKGGYINFQDTDTVLGNVGQHYGAKLAAMEHGFFKTKTQAKLYKKAHAFMMAISKAKDQMFTAFRGWDEAQTFFTGIEMAMDRTLTLKSKVLAQTLIMGGLATAISLNHVVNLVQIAHDMYDSSITTPAAFLADRRAQEYALQEIQNILDQMQEMSIAYNDGNLPTFATEDDVKLILISKYQNILKFTVNSDTYNADELGLTITPQRQTMWQGSVDGSGNSFSWDACTSIYLDANSCSEYSITPNADPETPDGTDYTTFKAENVVGFAYDKPGCCMALEKEKATVSYTAVTDHINEYQHYLGQQCINPAYGMVAFVLANAS